MTQSTTPPPQARSPALWTLVLWFAMLGGLTEVALLAVAKLYFHRYIHMALMVTWMAPVGEIVVLALPAALLALTGLGWRRLASLDARVAVLATITALSPLLIAQRLHRLAVLILAMGLAAVLTRLVRRHPQGFATLVRRTTLPLVALVLLLGGGIHFWAWRTERHAIAALPDAPAGAPNVLLIILDTVRAWDLSLYGYARPTTPELERWARRGVRFETALSTAPWTLPSHASIFTGRFPHELSATWIRTLDRTWPTLAEVMGRDGYYTAGFSANIFFAERESGLGRGFAHYEDWPLRLETLFRFTSITRELDKNRAVRERLGFYQVLGRKSAAQINQDFLHWLPGVGKRPFFAFLNYIDAHGPYLPPAPFAGRFGGTLRRNNILLYERYPMSAEDFRQARDAYDESLAYLDHEIGMLLDSLDRRGTLANTIVVIAADHGEEFGEHGLMEHGYSLYRASVQVPLLIIAPGRAPADTVVTTPVSLRNLAATITDMARVPGGARFPGRSLATLWRDPTAAARFADDTLVQELAFTRGHPSWFPSSKGAVRALVAGNFRYIRTADDDELFDFTQDPNEQHDLTATPRGASLIPWYRSALESMLGGQHLSSEKR